MDKKLLKMEKKLAAASGLQVSASAPDLGDNASLDSHIRLLFLRLVVV
jgi:hypothetical protein